MPSIAAQPTMYTHWQLIKFRDGRQKDFVSPIRTTPWESIKSPSEYEMPTADAMKSQQLAHEPEALKVAALPALTPDRFKQGVP